MEKILRIPFDKKDRIYRVPNENYDLIVRDVPTRISDDFMFAVIMKMEHNVGACSFSDIEQIAIQELSEATE
jgi:hypothetical protein